MNTCNAYFGCSIVYNIILYDLNSTPLA